MKKFSNVTQVGCKSIEGIQFFEAQNVKFIRPTVSALHLMHIIDVRYLTKLYIPDFRADFSIFGSHRPLYEIWLTIKIILKI